MTDRLCGCGCRASLAGMRADAVYHSEACKKRAQRRYSRDKAGTVHPLAEARADQEASKLKSDLSALIYQGIVERLTVAPLHADELEPLYPAEHRNLCRKLAPAQFGSLASRRYIRKIGERKSKFRSRNAAKSGIYEFTRLGRERLVGVDVEREGLDDDPLGVDPGDRDRPQVDAVVPPKEGFWPDPVRDSVDSSGEGSPAADRSALVAAGEPRPTLFDVEERPRSAWTDPEEMAA